MNLDWEAENAPSNLMMRSTSTCFCALAMGQRTMQPQMGRTYFNKEEIFGIPIERIALFVEQNSTSVDTPVKHLPKIRDVPHLCR